MTIMIVQFGNVKRLKPVTSDSQHILWYSGDKTFMLIDVITCTVLRKYKDVLLGLPNESIGFFDIWQQNYLIASTYAKDKRMLYMHDLKSDYSMIKTEEMSSVVKRNIELSRAILVRLPIFQWMYREES